MARAMRASTSSAVIVHSENGFDSRKLDEGRMAHPPLGCPLPCEPNYGRLKIVPSKTRRHGLAEPPTKLPRCRSPAGLSTLVAESLPRWERPPELPRAAFLPRRLAILRGVRRVGAGGRNLQGSVRSSGMTPAAPRGPRPHRSRIERSRARWGTMGIVAEACWCSTLGLGWGVRAEGGLFARGAGT